MSFITTIKNLLKIPGMKRDKKQILIQSGSLLEELEGIKAFQEVLINYPSGDRESLTDLKKISKDEIVNLASDFFSYAIMVRLGLDNYYHEDEKIMALVNDSIENMTSSFYTHCRDLLKKGIDFGFSVAQVIPEVVEERYLLGWMINYDSYDIENFEVAKGNRGKEFISKVKISGNTYPNFNFAIFRHGDLSNLYGYGRLNYLKKWYELKLMTIKLWAIFIQKFTIPSILAQTKGDVKAFVNRLKNWVYNNIIGIDESTEKVNLLEVKAGINTSGIYEGAIDFCNSVIFRVYFQLPALSDGSGGGSYALASRQFDMFMNSVDEVANSFKDDVLLTQIFGRLIDFNYGPQQNYGEFRAQKMTSAEDMKLLSEVFDRLINSGVIDPDIDNAWIREDLNIPELSEEFSKEENILREGLKKEDNEEEITEKEIEKAISKDNSEND